MFATKHSASSCEISSGFFFPEMQRDEWKREIGMRVLFDEASHLGDSGHSTAVSKRNTTHDIREGEMERWEGKKVSDE